MYRTAAAGAALLASAVAYADHTTRRLDALAAHVAARASAPGLDGGQALALSVASRALLKETRRGEWADVAVAARASRSIERAFPGDVEFGADLDTAIAAFLEDLAADRRALADLLPSIVDTKKASAARRRLDRIPVDDSGRASRSRAAKLSRLARRAAAVASAYELAGTGPEFVVGVVSDVPFVSDQAGADASPNGLDVGSIDWEGFNRRTRVAYGNWTGIHLAVDGVEATGTLPLANGTSFAGFPVPIGEWSTWEIGAIDTGGSITVTRFDPDARVIEGTFSFTAALTPDSQWHRPQVVEVSDGRFRARLP